jgi:hypothetical protein
VKHTITVLQDDIDKGKKGDTRECAIALAAKRDLADLLGEDEISVCFGVISMFDASHTVCHLPHEACIFIKAFDRGQPVKPFKFEVELRENL